MAPEPAEEAAPPLSTLLGQPRTYTDGALFFEEQVRRRARDSLDRSQRRGCLSSGLRVLSCLTTAERLVPTSRASKTQKQGKEMKEQEAS